MGMKGSRVQAVVQELRGEKIDIVPWNDDQARFVCNALSPAEVSRVLLDEQNNAMEIIDKEDGSPIQNEDMRTLTVFTELASLAISNARKINQVQRENRDLYSSYRRTAEAGETGSVYAT